MARCSVICGGKAGQLCLVLRDHAITRQGSRRRDAMTSRKVREGDGPTSLRIRLEFGQRYDQKAPKAREIPVFGQEPGGTMLEA